MSNEENLSGNSSMTSDGEASSESEAELMITNRERRKTAGNRYSQVVAQEQLDDDAEDDVALLFAEADGEDEEYNSAEADDEADMSSSDDDDQGPNTAPDDLEGEKELEKQAKVERQKKRKADMAMTTISAIRKKPKIDPTSLHRVADKLKPSKKKERVSWLPDEASAPGRTSKRKQTVAHREVMLERLKESEEQRLKNKAIREEKERIKQAEAPKQLTQADRLAEAEKNERRNAKSLNRWEAMEARRAEEQAAKLAALKERKLDGAVITFHSSTHVYRGPKITQLYSGSYTADGSVPKKRGPKPKSSLPLPSTAASPIQPGPPLTPATQSNQVPVQPSNPSVTTPHATTSGTIDPAPSTNTCLAGIREYAYLPSMPNSRIAALPGPEISAKTPQPTSSKEGGTGDVSNPHNSAAVPKRPLSPTQAPSEKEQALDPQPSQAQVSVPETKLQPKEVFQSSSSAMSSATRGVELNDDPKTQASTVPSTLAEHKPLGLGDSPNRSGAMVSSLQSAAPIIPTAAHPDQTKSEKQDPVSSTAQAKLVASNDPNLTHVEPDTEPPTPDIPIEEVTSTRNLIILDKLDALTAEAKQALNVFNGTKKSSKPSKHVPELCPITGTPARYRDPRTGIAYASVNAYRKLGELQQHKFSWSAMLGCYVGRGGQAARGVPQGFLGS